MLPSTARIVLTGNPQIDALQQCKWSQETGTLMNLKHITLECSKFPCKSCLLTAHLRTAALALSRMYSMLGIVSGGGDMMWK